MFSRFSKNEAIETNFSRDGPRLKSDNLRRRCRLQDRGALQGRSASRQHVVALRRGGREARLARGGIREHEAFLGHEMRSPAGTGRGGVLMAREQQGQGTGKENGVRGHRLLSPTICFWNLLMYFGFLSRWGRLLANIRSVYWYTWILNISHLFHLFIFLSNTFLIFNS